MCAVRHPACSSVFPLVHAAREAAAEARWAEAEARLPQLQATARREADAALADEHAALRCDFCTKQAPLGAVSQLWASAHCMALWPTS